MRLGSQYFRASATYSPAPVMAPETAEGRSRGGSNPVMVLPEEDASRAERIRPPLYADRQPSHARDRCAPRESTLGRTAVECPSLKETECRWCKETSRSRSPARSAWSPVALPGPLPPRPTVAARRAIGVTPAGRRRSETSLRLQPPQG